jgi:hypothetical protein
MLPVPIANSRAGPPRANSANSATVDASSPRGSASYSLAVSDPKLSIG